MGDSGAGNQTHANDDDDSDDDDDDDGGDDDDGKDSPKVQKPVL